MNMNIYGPTIGAGTVCAAVASALLSATAVAAARDVTVALRVSTTGLELRSSAGAQELYARIKHAATVACTRADRVGLAPVYDRKECVESAVGDAIRSANLPQLTRAYLGNHTLRDAAARGIRAPAELAAR